MSPIPFSKQRTVVHTRMLGRGNQAGHPPMQAQPVPVPVPVAPLEDTPDGGEAFIVSSDEEEQEEEEGEIYNDDAEYESKDYMSDDALELEYIANAMAEPREPRNKFMIALTSAAEQYSSRCRSRHSSLLTPPTPVRFTLKEDAESSTPELVDDDDSKSEDDFSSDDEHDQDFFMNRKKFTKGEAMKRFYNPSEPWAVFANEPIENPVVIAKFHSGIMCDASIKRGTLAGKQITYVSKTWALTQPWRGFFSEMTLYSQEAYLRPLQGDVVPRLIGLYLVDGAVSVAMELPSSSFWVEASEDMSHNLKKKCIEAFDKIHSRGVVHNDIELRHMLISAEGNVSIIDFQESLAFNPVPEIGLKQGTEADIRLEKRKIKFKLGYEDCRDRELQKRKRVRARLARIQEREFRIKRGEAPDTLPPIEPADPDDILNPIVNNTIWVDCWVGQDVVEPECYIVPGQAEDSVNAAIQEFLGDELDRKESDAARTASNSDTALSCGTGNTSAAPTSIQLHTPSPSPPTNTNKRKRDVAEDKEPIAAPPAKKVQLPQKNASSKLEHAQLVVSSNVSAPEPELVDELPVDEHLDDITDVVHVPFEGYDGPGGFTVPHIYRECDVHEMRRTWIMQYSIRQSLKDGLPYPLAARYGIIGSTDVPDEYVLSKSGKKKKRIHLTCNRGALKRARDEKENPGKRRKEAMVRRIEYLRRRSVPGTGLSDSEEELQAGPSQAPVGEDDIPEGPMIIDWQEMSKSERGRSPVRFVEPSEPPLRAALRPSAELQAPKKGIMRRQLSPEMRAAQLEFAAWLKEHAVPDDEKKGLLAQGKPSRAHGPMPKFFTQSVRPEEGKPNKPPLPVDAPTEENLRRLEALTKEFECMRPRRSSSRHSDDSIDSLRVEFLPGPSRLPEQSADSPLRGRSREEQRMSSKAKGKRSSRGDSPASDDGDTGNSSPKEARRANNRVTPVTLPYNPWRTRGLVGVPLSFGAPRAQTPVELPEVTSEDLAEMNEVENLVTNNIGGRERHSIWDWVMSLGETISRR